MTAAGWVQVTVDTDRAGSGLLNFAVDDLAATRDELAGRAGAPCTASTRAPATPDRSVALAESGSS